MAVQTGRDGACMHSGSRGRDAPRRLTTVMTTWLRVDRMNTASRPPRAISNSGPEPGHTRQAWKWADSTATMITQMPWKKAPMPAGMQTISVVVCHRRPHSTRAGIVETYGRSQAAYGSCCTSGLATHPKQRLLLVSSMLAAQHSSTRRLEVPCPRVSNSRKKEVETRCYWERSPNVPPTWLRRWGVQEAYALAPSCFWLRGRPPSLPAHPVPGPPKNGCGCRQAQPGAALYEGCHVSRHTRGARSRAGSASSTYRWPCTRAAW